jgi:hypothetical protein
MAAESTPRLPGLSLDFARDDSRDGELAEPKAWVCSGLTLSGASLPRLKRRGVAPPNESNTGPQGDNVKLLDRPADGETKHLADQVPT